MMRTHCGPEGQARIRVAARDRTNIRTLSAILQAAATTTAVLPADKMRSTPAPSATSV